jgi:hypothetical protein
MRVIKVGGQRDAGCIGLVESGLKYVKRSPRGDGQGEPLRCGVGDGNGNVQVECLTTSRSDGPEWYGRRLPVYGKRHSEQPVGGEGEIFVSRQ